MRQKTINPRLLKSLFLFLSLATVNTLLAGDSIPRTIFDVLAAGPADINYARPVTLRLPLDSVYAKSAAKQPALLSYLDPETGREVRRPLQVEVRGKFRRHLCSFPPLKLDFNKKQLAASGLARHDKLKLVTPCFDDPNSQALILREYLAYRLYAQITPNAFRTQLLKITYRDLHQRHPDRTVYAFVLEDTDEMAERLGGVEMEEGRGLAPHRFDRRAETTQALFSYFIGNLDWNLSMVRNLKFVALPGGEVIPVPYDFDFSGLVSAPYARLNTNVGQQYAGQRIYLGLACNDALLSEVFEDFQAHRREISNTVRHFRLLTDENRVGTLQYLNEFWSDFKRLLRQQGHRPEPAHSLYHRLRAEQFHLLPPGANPNDYGLSR